MRYGSVCSGIEAATQAWHPLGWTPAFFSEIEAFPSAVLAHHYGSNMPGQPYASNGVPNHGDMTNFEEWPDHAIDLLVGGTPCQSFSVAGLRGGLDDARGNLMLTYGAIARRYRPRWLVWENVPGVLSSDGGRDFASLLGLLSGRRVEVPADGWRNAGVVEGYQGAYGLAWRVLDAQYVRVDGYERAVPQRRRRVFVVGYLGDWRLAAAVLFEPEGMRGDSAPRREAGKVAAPTISSRPTGGGGLGTDFDLDGGLVASDVAPTMRAGGNRTGGDRPPGSDVDTLESLVAFPLTAGMAMSASRMPHEQGALIAFNRREDPEVTWDRSGSLGSSSPQSQAIAFAQNNRDEVRLFGGDGQTVGALAAEPGMKQTSYVAFPLDLRNAGRDPEKHDAQNRQGTGVGNDGDPSPTLTKEFVPGVATSWAVRRLTPTECARLQGFPDDHCRIPWRGRPADQCPDGPQYKAYGNSMAVNAMRWIGQRIDSMERLIAAGRTAA